MSFTIRIKEEMTEREKSKPVLLALLSSYIRNNGDFSKPEITMTTENKFLIDYIQEIINQLYQKKFDVEVIENLNFSKKELYQISIPKTENNMLEDLGIWNAKEEYLPIPPEYIVGGNEEIRGYLQGAFLGVGSINDPKTSGYHMELLASQSEEAVFLQKLLNIFDLNAKILSREKGYMIYIKEAEKISDFIKILDASKAVMYYEDVRVYHDKKNKTNRLNNCEQANMDKVIQNATFQLEDIEIIEKNDGLGLLDDKVRETLQYRKKYPESSLKELAEIISLETNKSITKSGLNHRLKKIRDLASRFRKMEKQDI